MASILQWLGNGLTPGPFTVTSAGSGDTAPSQVNITNTTITVVNSGTRAPGIQIQEAAVGSTGWIDWNFTPSTTVAFRGYFTPTGTLATNHSIFSIRDSAEVRIADINITGTGAIRVYDVANAYQSIGTTGIITPGTTYRFEVKLDTVSGLLDIAIYNGHSLTPIEMLDNVPGNFIASNAGCLRIGKTTNTQQAETQFWDDIVLTSDATFVGPAVITSTISAGADQEQIEPYATVTLQGNVLTGSVSSWVWSQTSGPSVTLTGNGASRTFVAPALPNTSILVFQVIADDGPSDTVSVSVNPHLDWIKTAGSISPLKSGITL